MIIKEGIYAFAFKALFLISLVAYSERAHRREPQKGLFG